MTALARDHVVGSGHPPAPCNWLEIVDKRVKDLEAGAEWREDSLLAPQRCRRFIMVRFPKLHRPFPDEVLSRELLRGEEQVSRSVHALRLLRGLNVTQRKQLAALLLDIAEALEFHSHYGRSSKAVRKLASEAPRRTRMLSRKARGARRKLRELRNYAATIHPLLGLKYVRAADRCLNLLAKLNKDPSVDGLIHLKSANYSGLENPSQLGIVQLYWFFNSECGCSRSEAQVRVAMIANDVLAPRKARKLRYISRYRIDRSKGSSAVRQAVKRFHPSTIE